MHFFRSILTLGIYLVHGGAPLKSKANMRRFAYDKRMNDPKCNTEGGNYMLLLTPRDHWQGNLTGLQFFQVVPF